jgi:hypothetical protein
MKIIPFVLVFCRKKVTPKTYQKELMLKGHIGSVKVMRRPRENLHVPQRVLVHHYS